MLRDFKNYFANSLVKNAISLTSSYAATSFFGLLFWIIAARTMPTSVVGTATAALSAASFIVILAALGMDQALIRYLPRADDRNALFSATSLVPFIISILVAIIFLAGLDLFAPALTFLRQGWYPVTFVIYVGVYSLLNMQNTAFVAIRRSSLFFAQNVLLGLRAPFLLLFASIGMLGLFVSFDLALVISFIFGACALYYFGLTYKFQISKLILRDVSKFSLGNYTAQVLGMMPASILPLIVINVVGATEAAYFYVAYSVASVLYFFPSGISTSLFVEGSHELPLQDLIRRSIKLTLTLLIPALVFMLLFGWILLLLFGRIYANEAFTLLRLLAISSTLHGLISIYVAVLKIRKDVRMITVISSMQAFLIVGLGYLGLSRFGLLGVGYAWIVVNAILSVLIAYLVFKKGDGNHKRD